MESSQNREWLRSVTLTACLLALVTTAVSSEFTYLVIIMLGMVLVTVGVFYAFTWQQNLIFLVEMTSIAIVMFLLSRDICAYFVHVGFVFSDFFDRIVRLSVPATAFLTMYSLNIIVFACIYQIFDRLTVQALFSVGGDHRALNFPEAIYFSVITLSTVGYGDITPLADSVRVVASLQIVLGVLLGLFGFAEIMRYATARRPDD